MYCCASVLFILLSSVSADLFQYYQPPMHHSSENGEAAGAYSLYLKPVLVERSSPVDVMYLTLDGKDVFLYPSAFHMLPYPLQRPNTLQDVDEPVNHHAEDPKEYANEEEDEHFSSSEERLQSRSSFNSTDVPSSTTHTIPTKNKETTKKTRTSQN